MAGKKVSIANKADASPADGPSSTAAPASDAPSSWSVLGRITLVLAASASLAAVAWTYIGPTVLKDAGFTILPSQITLTPAPTWVRSDVRTDVVKKAGLHEPLSLLDPKLSERLAKEFSLHPWVERVTAVRVHRPSNVEIDVDYRRPTVMVEVPGGLYPVDALGVLLPSADFSPVEAARYPRLGGASATPGPVGATWADPVVVDGARLAALLLERWESWRLYRISAAERDVLDAVDARPQFILATKSNKTRVLWGVAPGVELPSQPSAEEKLERLEKYVADLGALDHSTEPREIDLRPTDRLRVTPSVAQAPGFGSRE